MHLYTERFFSADVTRIILTVCSGILLILALIVHFLYAGFNGVTIKQHEDFTGSFGSGTSANMEQNTIEALFEPPIAYFVIAGLFQITVMVVYLLFLWEKIKPTLNKLAILNFLLIALYGVNFAIAVFTGIRWPLLKETFRFYLQMDTSSLSDKAQDYINSIKNVYNTTAVECILTFIVAIPIISLMIYMFLDSNFNKAYWESYKEKEKKNPSSAQNLKK